MARPRRAMGFALLVLSLAACAEHPRGAAQDPQGAEPGEVRNLLLITIDTLRADRLGTYGYPRPTSPRIDAFAQSAVTFDRAYATSSWTLPSTASIMTALYPWAHGCVDDRSRLDPAFETLAERLATRGFDTAAIVNHIYFDRRFGLDQGFAAYDDELVLASPTASHLAVTSDRVSDKAVAWLAARREQRTPVRWFLWIHYFDPHETYELHPGVSERFGTAAPSDRYDGEIAFTDEHIGRVLDELRRTGLESSTLVALVADHGEEFRDHGGTGHRTTLYEEVLRVPLILREPGRAARREARPASLVDVMPMALDILGIEAPEAPRPASDRPVLAELRRYRRPPLEAIIDGSWKLIQVAEVDAGETELYDLDRDPTETRNLLTEKGTQAARLIETKRLLWEQARSGAPTPIDDEPVRLSDEDLERLRNLGYVGGP